VQWLLERKMRAELAGAPPSLAAAMVPDYALGCKRVLLSDDFLPTFRDNQHVHLVTSPVLAVTEWVQPGPDTGLTLGPRTGVTTDAGTVELDVLVFASGFDIEGSICSFPTTGRGGLLLRTHFQEQPCAYLGITVPGFPNFFLVLGPNTVLAHSSLIYMIECQVRGHGISSISWYFWYL
jgi:cation diffusion facilitator CzcD-associated flavoprotein CzcO